MIIVYSELEIKKNYIAVFCRGRTYHRKNMVKDKCIDRLEMLFNDAGPGVEWVLMTLSDPDCRGVSSSLNQISIKGNKVILKPTEIIADNPDKHAVMIDRAELIRVTQEWQALVAKRAPEIFIYCKDGKYFASDALPEGIE